MSELKAYTYDDMIDGKADIDLKYYPKEDADTVIAEKDEEIAELKSKLEDLQNTYKESVEIKVKIWERCKKAEADAAETLALLEERNKQVGELKEMMPKYKQFIEDEDYRKKLVDEYAGYVYEWAGHRYIATPYINIFIKGILRTLYKALANWARSERYTEATWHGDEHREELWAEVQDKCLKKAEEYR